MAKQIPFLLLLGTMKLARVTVDISFVPGFGLKKSETLASL